MDAAAIKQKKAHDFGAYYDSLCSQANTYPLAAVKVYLQQRVLDLSADRIRLNDWVPILSALKVNQALEYIAIRSSYKHVNNENDVKLGNSVRRRLPPVRTKEVTFKLCQTLRDCIQINSALKCLELQGLPIREQDASVLAQGISTTRSINHISFEQSLLSNEVIDVLCSTVKNTMSITSLNLSNCGLTSHAAETIAEMISHQAVMRHSEAWKGSLRYRKPELDCMSGLRRITLNCNPMIGDSGAQSLADTLKDDLWIKAVDVQQCGITEVGGKAFLEILKYNTTIVVMDLRQNPLISEEVMSNIMDQVVINAGGVETEYQWIKAKPIKEMSASKPRQMKKKASFVVTSARRNSAKVLGSGGGSSKKRPRRPPPPDPHEGVESKPGIPWRTALRAQHYKGHPSDADSDWLTVVDDSHETTPLHAGGHSLVTPTSTRRTPLSAVSQNMSVRDGGGNIGRKTLHQLSHSEALKRIEQLSEENRILRLELDEIKSRQDVLFNDSVLDSIEKSFQQFHSFLDMLNDAGLGQLISMAGLDSANLSLGSVKAFNSSHLSADHSKSRLDTSQQMRSFVEEKSRLRGLDLDQKSTNHTLESNYRPTNEASRIRSSDDAADVRSRSMNHPAGLKTRSDSTDLKYRNDSAELRFRSDSVDLLSRSENESRRPADGAALLLSHQDKPQRDVGAENPSDRYDELYNRVIRDTEIRLEEARRRGTHSTWAQPSHLSEPHGEFWAAKTSLPTRGANGSTKSGGSEGSDRWGDRNVNNGNGEGYYSSGRSGSNHSDESRHHSDESRHRGNYMTRSPRWSLDEGRGRQAGRNVEEWSGDEEGEGVRESRSMLQDGRESRSVTDLLQGEGEGEELIQLSDSDGELEPHWSAARGSTADGRGAGSAAVGYRRGGGDGGD